MPEQKGANRAYFTLCYKYEIRDSNNKVLVKSEEYLEERVEHPKKGDAIKNHMFNYKFQKLSGGIAVKKDQRIDFACWIYFTAGKDFCYKGGAEYLR